MLSTKFKHLIIALVFDWNCAQFLEPDSTIKAQFFEHYKGLCSIS
nr:MAG TPA: hypothetical protein [Caudoviricetes sp.]